ncbi:MAG TPA: sigma 54-interacting transcriptional regulator, partial [Candidatus Angelobacter sp.]|nr:sigma 54-interacting transcriptional regulator [Candidatus Angelobacter sp.]
MPQSTSDPKIASEAVSATDFFFSTKNEVMREFMRAFQRAARTDWPVLITGEPGSGKELVARALHEGSLRAHEPFIKIDCLRSSPRVLEELVSEAEERSSAAQRTHSNGNGHGNGNGNGHAPAAPGTIFFHEITQLDPGLQARVFRIL